MIFPGFLYKDGGPHQRPGGTYSFKHVTTQEDADALLADGWVESIDEIDNPKAKVEEDDLETLKARAVELGIKGVHLYKSVESLKAKIAEVGG